MGVQHPRRDNPLQDSLLASRAVDDAGSRVVAALGEPGARELLQILEWPDADRAALIGRLYAREDARWLAGLLIDLEDDLGEIARLRLAASLRRTLDI